MDGNIITKAFVHVILKAFNEKYFSKLVKRRMQLLLLAYLTL
jgi:hypothetical protein